MGQVLFAQPAEPNPHFSILDIYASIFNERPVEGARRASLSCAGPTSWWCLPSKMAVVVSSIAGGRSATLFGLRQKQCDDASECVLETEILSPVMSDHQTWEVMERIKALSPPADI